MRKLTPVILLATALFILFYWQQDATKHLPVPTNGDTIIKFGEDEDQLNKKQVWFDLLHRSAEGTNWRAIEHQNDLRKHQQRSALDGRNVLCGDEIEYFADEKLRGTWKERGSSNQAGRVRDTEYDPIMDEIWIIAAGGTLFKGKRDGTEWTVVNQDLRFNHGLLKFIPFNGGRRLFAFSGRIPHYSDDDGLTWTPSEGIIHSDSWGNFHNPVVLNNTLNHFYVMAKPSYWEPVTLYKSVDYGANFHAITTFETHEFNRLLLHNPHHSDALFLIKQTEQNLGQIYRINPQSDAVEFLNEGFEFDYGNARTNLIAWSSDTLTRFYCYSDIDDQLDIYVSEDLGQTWVHRGELPANPWSVGLYVSPSDPDFLLLGEVDCFNSTNAGSHWERVNNWWEYYDDVQHKLHADMMHFSEFMTADSIPFILVSHDGGLTISEDYFAHQQNISLSGLNVSQYYAVRTDPIDPNFVYAGSQDQGFQVSESFEDELEEAEVFEQVISGDYGHIVFSNEGQALWTVYPGGWVTYYGDPQNGPYNFSYDLVSENESVWLPPLISSPYPQENAIYMAGGSIDEGPGSYLIRLEIADSGIEASQGDFDFYSESGEGAISAIAIAPSNPHYWYVATTNGRLFYSTDGGETWEQNINFIPDGHYLYGQTIHVSSQDESTLYLGGSGYSNPAVYKSTDHGQNFVPMTEGLPSTLVLGLTANSDESLLFAATETGPYVFAVAENRWYDLAGQCAPNQAYWSVEFIESINTARFGTYGRGIWDFQIDETVASKEPSLVEMQLKVYPNPTSGLIQVEYTESGVKDLALRIFDASGRNVFQTQLGASTEQLNLSHLPKGLYSLQINTKEGLITEKIIIQ